MRSAERRLQFQTLWLAGAVWVALLQVAPIAIWWVRDRLDPRTAFSFISNWQGIAFPAAFILFAILYALVEEALRLPIRRQLGWMHFAMQFAAVNLIYFPAIVLIALGGARRAFGLAESLQWLLSAGYLLALASLVAFVLLLIDALRNRFGHSHPKPMAP
jgi:hypothetical protein